jgi:uncharacterized protein YjdB/transglutaminase-like putative cysteine protease
MRRKFRISILLLILSLSIISQSVQAVTYYVEAPEYENIEFNRAMATNDREISLEYAGDETDYHTDLYGLQYALQDYADSDYAYYNMNMITVSQTTLDYAIKKLSVNYNIQGLETPAQTEYVYDTIHKLIIDNPSIIKASDYEKAAWAYHYVTSHVTYDYRDNDDNMKYSAYAALYNGTAVCQGYSLLYYALATELGIRCKIVSGEADNGSESGSHAWNAVCLDGKWYYVDTTWGAGSGDVKYFLALKKDLQSHTLDSIYENYFDFADVNYVEDGNSEYHGILASVYNVKLDPLKKVTMTSEGTFQWLLENPDQIKLTFSSGNPEVTTVTEDGVIKGVGEGTAVIKAVNEDLGIEQECEVVVADPDFTIMDYDNIKVIYQKTATISLMITPADVTPKNITYQSKDETIATVDKDGIVTGKRAGSTKIMVTHHDQKFEIPVTVSPSVNSRYKSVILAVKKTASIKNAVFVSSNGYKDLTFQSTDSKIAKVSSTGIVTGVKKGSCAIKIYDKATNKLAATVKVKVN